MPAYFDTGFCVRVPSWHGEETLIAEHPKDWNDAREKAGLTWEAKSVPAFCYRGIRTNDDGSTEVVYAPADPGDTSVVGDFVAEPGHHRIIRDDTGGTLHVAKTSWELITIADMGEVIEALAGAGAKIDTAGSVRDGKGVFATILLDEPFQIPGDKSQTLPMMALTNTFDGQGSLRAGYTSIRVVCANTFGASEAEQDRHGHTFVFRHTKNWRERVDDAKAAISGLREDTTRYVEAMTHLAEMRVTPVMTEQFVRSFIPTPPDGLISDRVAENIGKDRNALRALIASDTVEGSGVGGTAYGLVQAAGEFLDHVRGYRSRDTYVGRQLLRPEPLKGKAISLVRELVTASAN